ncbi:hypothetical protein [Kingella potus]|uniref:hypothetical protein n=1 Tax=Kingella potus TaxID=265175 RepID=UPI001FD07D67|nr:hypothetical protein [Kingella potus]UOP00806.1 hypothetical protein LVJ84_13825 [Kingella potus]
MPLHGTNRVRGCAAYPAEQQRCRPRLLRPHSLPRAGAGEGVKVRRVCKQRGRLKTALRFFRRPFGFRSVPSVGRICHPS